VDFSQAPGNRSLADFEVPRQTDAMAGQLTDTIDQPHDGKNQADVQNAKQDGKKSDLLLVG